MDLPSTRALQNITEMSPEQDAESSRQFEFDAEDKRAMRKMSGKKPTAAVERGLLHHDQSISNSLSKDREWEGAN